MNVEDLSEALAEHHGFTKAFSGRVVRTLFETIRSEIKAGGVVRIRNFGTFDSRTSHGKPKAKFTDSKNFFRKGGPSS
jgi:nucleoid DNA-binding protein